MQEYPKSDIFLFRLYTFKEFFLRDKTSNTDYVLKTNKDSEAVFYYQKIALSNLQNVISQNETFKFVVPDNQEITFSEILNIAENNENKVLIQLVSEVPVK